MSTPLPPMLRPLAVPAAWIYGRFVAARNRRFDRGRGVVRLKVPVVSIGNLSAGGTGKTPVVQWTAHRLAAAGFRPAIALRGYKAGGDRRRSDEALEHAEAVPEAVVLADPDRAAAVAAAMAAGERIDAVVLDDGFQHRRVARDLDIVLIDARAGTLTDRLLPAGWLREPPASLRRADAILITHAAAVDESLARDLQRLAGRRPVAWTRHRWSGLRVWPDATNLAPSASDMAPVDWLEQRPIAVLAGIARPAGVVAMAEAAGARVVRVERVSDHHRHEAAGWRAVLAAARAAGAEAVLVTRKDRVKLAALDTKAAAEGLPILEPVLELAFLDGEAEFGRLIDAAVGDRIAGIAGVAAEGRLR